MSQLNKPHDKFFKEVMQNKENATAFLQNTLPQNIVPMLNFSSLNIEKDSFISNDLKENFTDLLYSINISKQKAYIYVLFEHKSYHDPKISLQLLKYMLECWNLKQQQNQQLPLILPIVFYHDKTEWKTGHSLASIVNVPHPDFLKYLPNFTYEFVEASPEVIHKFANIKKLQLMINLLKDSKCNTLTFTIDKLLLLLQGESIDKSFLIAITVYILETTDLSRAELIQKMQKVISEEGVNVVMSTAQKLREEGRIEGKLEGIGQVVEQLLKQQIKEAPKSVVLDLTNLSDTNRAEFFSKLMTFSTINDVKLWLSTKKQAAPKTPKMH